MVSRYHFQSFLNLLVLLLQWTDHIQGSADQLISCWFTAEFSLLILLWQYIVRCLVIIKKHNFNYGYISSYVKLNFNMGLFSSISLKINFNPPNMDFCLKNCTFIFHIYLICLKETSISLLLLMLQTWFLYKNMVHDSRHLLRCEPGL